MAKAKTTTIPIAERRGVPLNEPPGSWEAMLVRLEHSSNFDEVARHLEKAGFSGGRQREVAEALWSGNLEAPPGKWALLGKLKGHDWCFFCPSWLDYRYPPKLAAESKLQVLFTGHQDTASATSVIFYDRKEKVVEYHSVGFPREGHPGGMSDTFFQSAEFERDWLRQFKDEFEAQSALVAHFGGYAPFLSLSYPDDVIEISAYDEDLETPTAWERIDLLVMEGSAKRITGSKKEKPKKKTPKIVASTAPKSNARPATPPRREKEPSLAIKAPKSEALPGKKYSRTFYKILGQPAEITLTKARGHKWADPAKRDAAEAALKEMGYSRIGMFVGDIFVNIRILAMVSFLDDAYAVIGESGGKSFVDLLRIHEGGGGLTVTNARVPKSMQVECRRFKTIRLPGKSEQALVETLRATRPPKSGIKPVNANRFKEDYEWFYDNEMTEKLNIAKKL